MTDGTPESQTVEPSNAKKGWTPEARAKLSRALKAAHRRKKKAGEPWKGNRKKRGTMKSRAGFVSRNGKQLHWTQTASRRVKLLEAINHQLSDAKKLKTTK